MARRWRAVTPAAASLLRRRDARPSGSLQASSASRRSTASARSRAPSSPPRRAARLCRADAGRQAAARSRRRCARGRRRSLAIDAATRANLELTRTLAGETRRQPARRDRPHRDRRPARACWRARLARPLDRPRRDRRAGSTRSRFFVDATRAAATICATRCSARPTSTARAVAAVARPRRPARSRRGARRPRRRASRSRDLLGDAPMLPPEPALAPTALAATRRRSARRCEPGSRARRRPAARYARRRLRRARASTPSSTRRARCATTPPRDRRRCRARYARRDRHRGRCKIKHNNVLGYFIEVHAPTTASAADAAAARDFIHRQTHGRRHALHHRRAGRARSRASRRAADRALALELDDLRRARRATSIAAGDDLARSPTRSPRSMSPPRWPNSPRRKRCRPARSSTTRCLRDRGRPPSGGRAGAAPRRGGAFVANDCDLDARGTPAGRIWLRHRPQHGRQVDLPAPERADRDPGADGLLRAGASARISASSTALFSRVGAADDLARGRSTFMVEMVETAAILNQATASARWSSSTRSAAAPRPSTASSIAWAAVEHLHEVNRCRALFATHYHELTALAAAAARPAPTPPCGCKEWQGDVVFLHEVAPGAADRSYGIQVAQARRPAATP